MSWTGPVLNKAMPILREMPEGIYFDVFTNGLKFQASTQTLVKEIRTHFRGVVWKRTYDKALGWWEYSCKWEGWDIEIYNVKEAPAQCKAITETRTVTKKVPIAFEERQVEETVIVGWDCGKPNNSNGEEE